MELKSVLTAHLLLVLVCFVSGLQKVEEMIELPPATTIEAMKAFGFRDLDEIREVLNEDEGVVRGQKQESADEEDDLLHTLLHPMTVLKLENLAGIIGEARYMKAGDASGGDGKESSSSSKEKVSSYVQHPAMLLSPSSDDQEDP